MTGDLFGHAGPAKKAQPHQNGADTSDVWLTPRRILDPLGPFDLDPCTPPEQPWPTAARRYTEADNGLIKPWEGRVWMNPPYSRPAYSQFMARMAEHDWGIALIFARTETRDFFAHVWESASGLLFLKGRVAFHRPDGSLGIGNSGAPSVLCAYGIEDADILASCGLAGAFVPLRLPRFFAAAALSPTWREAVLAWIRAQPGPISVADLYQAFAGHPKTRDNRHWKAKLRQVLQLGPFERVGRGEWRAAT